MSILGNDRLRTLRHERLAPAIQPDPSRENAQHSAAGRRNRQRVFAAEVDGTGVRGIDDEDAGLRDRLRVNRSAFEREPAAAFDAYDGPGRDVDVPDSRSPDPCRARDGVTGTQHTPA